MRQAEFLKWDWNFSLDHAQNLNSQKVEEGDLQHKGIGKRNLRSRNEWHSPRTMMGWSHKTGSISIQLQWKVCLRKSGIPKCALSQWINE